MPIKSLTCIFITSLNCVTFCLFFKDNGRLLKFKPKLKNLAIDCMVYKSKMGKTDKTKAAKVAETKSLENSSVKTRQNALK